MSVKRLDPQEYGGSSQSLDLSELFADIADAVHNFFGASEIGLPAAYFAIEEPVERYPDPETSNDPEASIVTHRFVYESFLYTLSAMWDREQMIQLHNTLVSDLKKLAFVTGTNQWQKGTIVWRYPEKILQVNHPCPKCGDLIRVRTRAVFVPERLAALPRKLI